MSYDKFSYVVWRIGAGDQGINTAVPVFSYSSADDAQAYIDAQYTDETFQGWFSIQPVPIDTPPDGYPTYPSTVPSAPQDLAGTWNGTTCACSWSAPTSDGGDAITGYHLSMNDYDGNSTDVSATTFSTSFTATVDPGSSFTLYAHAVNACGRSEAATLYIHE